jgi:quercetin dioxygenase-like cupin family protein
VPLKSTSLRLALVGAGMAAMVAVPSSAYATPGSGATAKEISKTTIGGKDYVVKEITLAPGGSTGWHFHPGMVYGLVKKGTLTHNDSDCSVDGVYKAGSTIVERSGSGYVHIGRNLGKTPVVLDVLYIDPAGSELAKDAPNPGCDFE